MWDWVEMWGDWIEKFKQIMILIIIQNRNNKVVHHIGAIWGIKKYYNIIILIWHINVMF